MQTYPNLVSSRGGVGELHLANVRLICKERGMKLVADFPFTSGTTNAQHQKMVDQLAPTGAHMMLNHGSSRSTQMVGRMGEQSRGMIFAQVVPSPWERKTSITREYQEEFARFKAGPDFSYAAWRDP